MCHLFRSCSSHFNFEHRLHIIVDSLEMDEAEDRVGEDCGSELTSFEEILSMVGPDSVSTVTTVLTTILQHSAFLADHLS